MSVISFNVASVIAIPVQDIYGNPITNPTAISIPGITSLDLNITGSINNLMAEKQFAISGLRGTYTVDGKFHAVQQGAQILSTLYTGQGWDTTTAFENVYLNQLGVGETIGQPTRVGYGVIPPASPSLGAELYINPSVSYPGYGFLLPNTIVPTKSLGVLDIYGKPWGQQVGGVPSATREWYYGPSHITGLGDICFSFFFTDIFPNYPTDYEGGPIVVVSFSASQTTTLPVGQEYSHLKLNNVIAGSTPVLQLIVSASFQGKAMTIILPWTVSTDLSLLSMRSHEFSGYDIAFNCFPDNSASETILEAFFIE